MNKHKGYSKWLCRREANVIFKQFFTTLRLKNHKEMKGTQKRP